jgi:putative transposase
MKRRNPRFGCRRIAQQIAFLFGVEIDKDVVRRVLAKHCRPTSGSDGPSWITTLGRAKDSLWSVDLFRCESLILKTHWVMVVMDQFTRRIIGFSVQPSAPDGPALCRMFNQVIAGATTLPQYLSSDHDPLFEFHRWKANLRILDVSEIKTVPHVPLGRIHGCSRLSASSSRAVHQETCMRSPYMDITGSRAARREVNAPGRKGSGHRGRRVAGRNDRA